MYVFDSDHLSLLQRQSGDDYRILAFRCQEVEASELFVTIVSFHEQFNGWTKFISRSKGASGLVRGYFELEGVINTFARAQVLPFSSAAADVYEDLRKQRIRVGAMDLRIASITIANQMTLLTRNRVDFERVPGLIFDDWTVRARNENSEQ